MAVIQVRKLWKIFKISILMLMASMYFILGCWKMNVETKSKQSNTNVYEMDSAFQYNIPPFENLKNPCYRSVSDGILKCLPYAFIAGMPKCGTSDVFFLISSHPNIESTYKEPHWWTRQRFSLGSLSSSSKEKSNNSLKYPLPLDTYHNYYEAATQHIAHKKDNIIIDASASTLWDMDYWSHFVNYTENPGAEPDIITAHYIKQLLPKTRVLAILRNPVQRLYSDYLYFNREKSSPEYFHQKTLRAVSLMTECIQKYGIRSCVYNIHLNQHKLQVRLRLGIYHVFLEDWLNVFAQDQIMVIRLEHYKQHREQYLKQICQFLNISFSISESLLNEGSRAKANLRIFDNYMLPETRQLLTTFYQPFNQRLAELMKDDGYNWA